VDRQLVNSSHALALAGPAGIAVLTNYLFIGIDAERDHASWALHYVPDKPGVAAMLIAAADSDTNSTVRANALRSLEKSGAPAELIVPLGQKHFRGVGWEEQWAAICMLRPYCNRPDVRSLFEEAMKYNDDRLRRTAQRALAK
jgi:hypothetical protein